MKSAHASTCHRLSRLCSRGFTGCRFGKLPCDSAQGLSLSNGKAPSLSRGKALVTFSISHPGVHPAMPRRRISAVKFTKALFLHGIGSTGALPREGRFTHDIA